jgi:uncharacterized protein involved in outer membrane biogenesis
VNNGLKITIAVLALILFGLFLGPMLIDWNRYKPEAEAWLSREAGRQVTIGGDLSVRLLPQPRLGLKKVQVVPRQGGLALLTVGALDVRIAILPLFIGRITVTSLSLDQPVLAVERLADGKLNLGEAPPPRPQRRIVPAGFSLTPHAVMIDKVEIARGTARYHDALLDWSETIAGIDATGVAGADGAYRAQAGFSWAGQLWTLSVDLSAPGQGGQRPLTLVLEQAAAGLKAQLTGRSGPGKTAPWQIGGAVTLQLASPSVFGASAAAFGSPAQNSTAPPLMLEGALSADPASLTLRDAALRWGEFTASGGIEARFEQQPWLTLHLLGSLLNLDAVRPDLAQASRVPYWPIAALQLFSTTATPGTPAPGAPQTPARGLGSIWQGTADVKLDALVFAQGRIEKPRLDAAFANGIFEIKDLMLVLPGDTELHVQGKTAPGGVFDGAAQLAGERARELFLWAGVPVQPVQEGRLMGIAYKGGLRLSPGAMRLSDFESGLDGSTAKGTLALSRPAESGPQIEADLTISRMNVDPYRALFASEASPLDTILKILDAASGPIKLAVGTLLADGYEARGLQADLNLSAAGGLTLRSLTIDDLLGAQLSLSGSAKALSGAASLSLTGTSTGLDLRPLFARLGIAAPKGEAALGPSAFDLKAALNEGSGEITAEGYLAGGKAGARLALDKAEAPLLGRLGMGKLSLDAVAEGQSLVIAGRLAGYDPPLGKPGAPSDAAGPAYATVPAADAQIPPGWVYLSLVRDAAHYAVESGAGLPGGKLNASFEREGDPASGRYTLKLQGGVPDAAGFFAALGVPEARRKDVSGALGVSLAAQGPANAAALGPASFTLGAMTLTGEGKLDLSGAKPVFAGTLHGGAADLDFLGGLLPKMPASGDVPGPWSEEKLDLSGLGAYEGSLAVELDRLTVGHLPFEKPKFTLALKDGTLALNDLRTSLFGGPLTANLALRGGAVLPGVAASVKFIQLDGEAFSRALWGKSPLKGELAGSLSLTAQGESTAALAATASGALSLKGAAGTVIGIDRQNAAAERPFLDLALETDIANGVAEIKDGHIGLTDDVASVTGHAALAPFTLDLAVKPGHQPWTITLDGPLDAPQRKLQ